MRDARLQYFLTLGMLGTVLPYVSVFFLETGLSQQQIGKAFAIYAMAAVISPTLLTTLADRFGDARRWLAGINLFSGGFLLWLSFARSPAAVWAAWIPFCLACVAIFPMLIGIHFGQQEHHRTQGKPQTPFHKVRAWGTIGYVFSSVVLYPFLRNGMSLRWVLASGAALAVLAAAQTLLMDKPAKHTGEQTKASSADSRPPAVAALASLFSPRMRAFTCAVIAMSMVSQILAAFYPVYLTSNVGLDKQWLGQASNVAVAIEAVLIFTCGRLLTRLGLKQLLLLCILATGLRTGLLTGSSSVYVAIGSQVFHGFLIIAIGVLPQSLFNDHADEHFRHSMQGVLVMLTSGGQCAASFLAGYIAGQGISSVFGCATILCVIAAALAWYGFHETTRTPTEPEIKLVPESPDDAMPLADVA